MTTTAKLRNIAIIAHVDHGKTTLVDQLLKQSGTLDARKALPERVMDSNDLERERGITILAKNTAITWQDYRINIVDTPGHADFGGEVERVLSMVDCVLLLVDAVDGPMPQTRFVTQKAFSHGLRPIVVINKIDRDEARPDWVLGQTFDLFDQLGATEEQLDFPVVYASALRGFAGNDPKQLASDMTPLFEAIIKHCPPPDVDVEGPLQLQISQLDYSSYVGAIGIGRIKRGQLKRNSPVTVVSSDGKARNELNTSPFCGREGKYVTSRQIRERLTRETLHNVALRVEDTENPDKFMVFGRGELHLGVLLENMRREGYELAVSRPRAVVKEIDGKQCEPYESVAVDLDENNQGAVMQALGERGGQLTNMQADGKGRVRLDYMIPSRGLIGFQTDFRTMTSGTGLLHHIFDHFGPVLDKQIGQRQNGVMISNGQGKALTYALFSLQERGRLMVGHGDEVYEGQIVGIHSRDNDLVVNPLKAKKLTNMRAAGKDENLVLSNPIRYTLEQAMEFIDDDELVEITPAEIRLRKRALKEHERKRAGRASEESDD
ncbi:MAG: GTP-binding protein [Steroidobacter sp.]